MQWTNWSGEILFSWMRVEAGTLGEIMVVEVTEDDLMEEEGVVRPLGEVLEGRDA